MKSMKSVLFISMMCLIASCSSIRPETDTGNIKVSKKVFDLTNGYLNGGEPDQNIIDEMLRVSENPQPVYINWQLTFSGIEDFDCRNCILSPNEGDGFPISKDSDLSMYSIPVHTYSTHFLFDVLLGSTAQFPFNAVSCYQSGSGRVTIKIQGYYSAISYSVPTAIALELRPINPCIMIPAGANF